MNNGLLILSAWYLVIPLSILGYGFFFQKIIFKNNLNLNIGYLGIIGIFFLIIYSYLSNLFVPHSKIHNFFVVIVGITFFIRYYYFYKEIKKEEIKLFFLISTIIFISIFIFKNHDDFEYYHFPYTYLLTQHDLIIGLGNFGHGFRTQSSIFYLNSLFYLPFIDFYLFNLGAVLILIFTNLILINYIFENSNSRNINLNTNYLRYLSLSAVIFINIFFYRISEHGTDRSSQILIFLLFIEIIYFLNLKSLNEYKLSKIYLLLGIIVSLKAFYILYLITFILLFFHVFKKSKKFLKTLKFFIDNKVFLFFTSLISLILITNFFNTGCFVYPIYFTCFENFSWSIPTEQVKQMNNWYELWSKAGAGPDFRISNQHNYIENFSWVNNWFKIYFFTKVSDLLLGLTFLSIVFLFVFYEKREKKIKNNIYFVKSVYALVIVLIIEWFVGHPALRYGGFVLISLLFFLPLSFKLNENHILLKVFLKKALILTCIAAFIFFSRNILRIHKEYERYNYNLVKNIFYQVDEKHFRIQNKLEMMLSKNSFCEENKLQDDCLGELNKISKKFGKMIIENK